MKKKCTKAEYIKKRRDDLYFEYLMEQLSKSIFNPKYDYILDGDTFEDFLIKRQEELSYK